MRVLRWFDLEVLDSYAIEGIRDAGAVLPAILSNIQSDGDVFASDMDCASYQAYLDRWHVRPLHMSARRGYLDLIRFEVESGTPIESRDEEGNTPLHRAVLGSQIKAALLLIELGADANARDEESMSPLHWALLTMSSQECVDLVAAGADPNLVGSDGETPLHQVDDKDLEAAMLKAHATFQAEQLRQSQHLNEVLVSTHADFTGLPKEQKERQIRRL